MRAEHDHISLTDALSMTRTNAGRTLLELSRTDTHHSGLLLVFLRHAGCAFCRETLADLAKHRKPIEGAHARIVLVHMAPSDSDAATFFARYGLGDLQRVADPSQALYRAFELDRATRAQLFSPRTIVRAILATIRHGAGGREGDVLQMPGAFLVRDGVVVRAHRHATPADRPDYRALASP